MMESENNIADRLPHEIIAKILSYLPSTYRKQARLVCSKWYEASNDITILKHQKFVFNNYHDVQLIVMFDTLEGIFNYYNLDFVCSSLNEQFESFIEAQGSMIYSLRFRDCSFSFKTLEKVMINCVNLKELFFLEGDCYLDDTSHIPSINGDRIVRKNLKVLEICNCKWMSDLLLTVFITVYPHVEKLVLEEIAMIYDRRIFNRFYKNAEAQPSDCVLTYRHFYQTVAQKCHKITKLSLAYPLDDGLSDEDLVALTSTSCFKLKELNILRHRAISSKAFKNFLSQQKNIISLDVMLCRNFDFECFQFLLHQNPNLEYLYIDSLVDVPKIELFELLTKSRLKSFQCEIRSNVIDLQHNINNAITNDRLEEFDFTIDTDDGYLLLLPMLKTFSNLTYLNLSFCHKMKEGRLVSSYIFKHMIHLETIKLLQCGDWVTDASFQNTAGRLRNLQYLSLNGCVNLTENAIKNFYYPKLKFINLNLCSEIKDCGFIHLSNTSPLLEHLDVSDTNISKEALFTVCRKLKFLRYLLLSKIRYAPKGSIFSSQELEQCCPSLRFVEIELCAGFAYNPEKSSLETIKNINCIVHSY